MVRSVDVARRLEVSKPSVCHAVAALKKICRMAAWRWGWRKKGKPCLSVPRAAKSPAKSRRIPQTSCFRGWRRKICSWPLRPLWMFPSCQIAPAAFSRCQCASLRRTDSRRLAGEHKEVLQKYRPMPSEREIRMGCERTTRVLSQSLSFAFSKFQCS